MLQTLAFQSSSNAAPAAGFLALFIGFWCFGIVLVISQFVLFLVALIQILSRTMPTDAKILWCCVSWFVPIIGPILWWTIGAKQHPQAHRPGPQGQHPPYSNM